MEPNPECRWCHGTGKVALFTSVVACDCIFLPKEEAGDVREPRVDMHIGWGYDQDEHGAAD